MALGMMIPGMLSGWLQECIGYQNFFIWVIICAIPGLLPVLFVKIDPKFGIKK
jgi:PAT family beta-lactamase induction signal transducer AmpG